MAGMRAFLICLLATGASAFGPSIAQNADVTVVSGKLERLRFAAELFHIDELWMQVAADTEFHRWLSQGIDRQVVVTLTAEPDRFGDRDRNAARILRGTLMHGTAPSTSPIVHTIFLQDELTGSLGAVTFQTDDPVIARKFDSFDDGDVGIVIEIK